MNFIAILRAGRAKKDWEKSEKVVIKHVPRHLLWTSNKQQRFEDIQIS